MLEGALTSFIICDAYCYFVGVRHVTDVRRRTVTHELVCSSRV